MTQLRLRGLSGSLRDGRLVDEATLRSALADVDDLSGEIRAARFIRAAA
jgi:chromate reductase